MTTAVWSSPVNLTSDAGFRTTFSEFSAKLALMSELTKTTDTGQINWSTVTLPGSGSDGGYEIWAFSDSEFGTAPVYFKFKYGISSGGGAQIKVSVGTATDGAGNLSGTTYIADVRCAYEYKSLPASPSQNFDSYMSCSNGAFWFYWKASGPGDTPSGADAAFFFSRTCDATGARTAEGALIYGPVGLNGTSVSLHGARYAGTQLLTTNQGSMNACLVPFIIGRPNSSDASGVSQVNVWYTVTPTVEPIANFCAVATADASLGQTFTATMVGSTSHTFIALQGGTPSNGGAGAAEYSAVASIAIAGIWE